MFQTIVFLGFTHTRQVNKIKKSANRLTFSALGRPNVEAGAYWHSFINYFLKYKAVLYSRKVCYTKENPIKMAAIGTFTR